MAELNKSRSRNRASDKSNKKRQNLSAERGNRRVSSASENLPSRKTGGNQNKSVRKKNSGTKNRASYSNKRKKRKNKNNYIIYYVLSIITALVVVIILSVTILFPIERIMVTGDFKALSSAKGNDYKSDGSVTLGTENRKYEYTEEEITSVADIKIGENLIRFNSKEVEERLIKNLYALESVKLIKNFPNTVTIRAFTASSRALVAENGKFYAVSSAGRIIEETDSSGEMIKIYGLETEGISPGDYLTSDNDKQISAMNIVLSEIEGLEITGIESIDLTDYLNIILNWENKISIVVGTSGEMKLKLSVAKELLDSYLEYNARGKLWVNDPETPRFRPESAETYIPNGVIIGSNSSGDILETEDGDEADDV